MDAMKRKKLKAARSRKEAPTAVNGDNSEESVKTATKYTPADLLDRAEALLEEEAEVDAAQRFCLRALEMEPQNVRALQLTGLLFLESGDDRSAEARFCLERAAELGGSEIGHSVHLYLGQLTEGKDSVEHYQAGIDLLRKELESEAEQSDHQVGAVGGASADNAKRCRWRNEPASWRLVSTAHCAVAEIYMTDLCDEPDAEERCRTNIEAAKTADSSNPEAHNMWAAFHLVKQLPEVARQAMVESLALWQPALRAALEQDEDEEAGEANQNEQVDVTTATGLNFDSRFNCSKTLVELGMLEEAAEVLESCHMENDEDVQVLYLSAVTHFRMWEEAVKRPAEEKEEDEEVCVKAENARTFLNTALDAAQEAGEGEVLEHVREMLEQLGEAGKVEDNLGDEIPESSEDEEEKMEEG